jgi:class 3 adenylate cyclase
MGSVASKTWTWRFDVAAAVLWPVLADTPRFNEALGLPDYEVEETLQPDGTLLRRAEAKVGKYRLVWHENPFEWITGKGFTQIRDFLRGPFRRFSPRLELASDGTGCIVSYTLTVETAGLVGRLLLWTGFFRKTGRAIDRLMHAAAAYAAGTAPMPFPYTAPVAGPELLERIRTMVVALESSGNGHGHGRRLADFLISAQEVDLMQIRPLALAREWRAPKREIVELCLGAVTVGLMEMRWNLLCPRCRGAKATAGTLDRLPQGAHCNSCAIDYGRDFSRNVEMIFRPSAAIRPVSDGEYCISGPMATPHVVLQQILEPLECREVESTVAPGAYRVRTLEPGGSVEIDWSGEEGFPTLVVGIDGVDFGPPVGRGLIRLENRGSRVMTPLIESRAWLADCLTGHDVTTLQSFRDLFSDQTLRPGDEVAIGRVALLFSDLRGSTALYERVGDAAAYGLVRAHFADLTEVIRRHDGAVVKTIGDAVMAAFARPADALLAALAIQATHDGGDKDALMIKLGVHAGPCVAVTLNGRLDYFGSTVNLAARLQDRSLGGDIVVSESIAADPTAAAVLAPLPGTWERAALKGMASPIGFLRLWPPSSAVAMPAAGAR